MLSRFHLQNSNIVITALLWHDDCDADEAVTHHEVCAMQDGGDRERSRPSLAAHGYGRFNEAGLHE